MLRMAEWAKLIQAIAGLVGAVAWPVSIVLAVWLVMRRHRDAFERFVDRIRSLTYPGGQIDLGEAVDAGKARVEELAEQVATPDVAEEERREIARELARQAQRLGAIEQWRDLTRAPEPDGAIDYFKGW